MKLLITGSNGLLGQKLIDLCCNQNDIELIVTAKGTNRHKPATGYTFQSLDITDYKQVEKTIALHKPDVVIHTAAMTNVDLCESDHKGCDALNVDAVKYLVTSCNNYGVHLVHVSTDFIFNGKHGPVDEKEKPDPISYYGQSKLLGEMLVRENAVSWTIIRAILVFGVVHDMSRSNFVLWAKQNLEQGKEINVVDDQYRTPTLAEDLAIGCLLAAKKKASGIFHIGGKDFLSIYEAVLQIADFWKLNKDLIHRSKSSSINQPAKRPPITGFIIDKARKELGYEPRSFVEGLEVMNGQLMGS